jgi:hypothetical protein
VSVTRVAALLLALLISSTVRARDPAASRLDIVIDQRSVRLDGIELRSSPRAGALRYFSLKAAEKVLGPPQNTYLAGLGVTVFAWTDIGIHLQRGFRGSDKGKLFKIQVWLDDSYSKKEDKRSGKFIGRVRVEGVDITSETSFERVRPEFEKAGFDITEHRYVVEAAKGRIRIFTVGLTDRLERVEMWCP